MSIRRIPLPSRAMAVALLALFVASGGTALAANPTLFLNQGNTATAPTGLTANVAGRTLQLTNTSTASGATPLGLTPGAGRPPFVTPSTTKVANLNADKLDGIDSTGLIQGKGKSYTLAVSIPRQANGSYKTYTPSPATVPGFINVSADCPGIGTNFPVDVNVANISTQAMNLFFRNDNYVTTHYVGLDGSPVTEGINAKSPDITTLTVQGSPSGSSTQTVTVATVSTVVRTSDCHFQVQAFTTNP